MATVIDITNKIKNEEKFVKIGDESYKVDTGKNAMTRVIAVMQDDAVNGVEALDVIVKNLLGEDGFNAIEAKNYSFSDYQIVVTALLAAARDMTFEEAEATFRKAVKAAE